MSAANGMVRLLLVEDNPGDAEMVAQHLRDIDRPEVELVHMGDLRSALDHLLRSETDLVLLDLQLPDAHGLETVRRVLENAPGVPIVVLTGRTDDDLTAAVLEAGAQDYITKGELSPGLLGRAIRYAITRQMGERQRERQARFLGELVANISDVLVVTERDGTIVYVSPSVERLLGYRQDERIGRSVTEFTHSDDVGRARSALRRALEEPGTIQTAEARLRHKDGKWRTIEMLVQDLTGSPIGGDLLVTARDLTERRERERALARRTHQLQERVKEQGCLYDISRLLHEQDRPLAERLQDVVDRIPAGWQHPEITVARLRVGDTTWASDGFDEAVGADRALRVTLGMALGDASEPLGELEVRYVKEPPARPWLPRAPEPTEFPEDAEAAAGVFLPEERRLLEEIGGRVTAEVLRRREERRLDRLVRTMTEAVTIVDRDGRITFANPAAEKLFGLTTPEITARGYDDPRWRITAVDGSELADEDLPFRRVMDTGQPVFDAEHAIVRGGERVLLSINAAPIRDGDGPPAGIVATCRDITEEREQANKLRERTEFLHNLMRATPAIIFRVDLPDLRTTYVGHNVEEITGISVKTFLREPDLWTERVPEEDLERFGSEVDRAAREGRDHLEVEYRLRHADGELHWYHVVAGIERDGEGTPVALVGSAINTTEKVRSGQALAESERRYRALFEEAHEAISITTPDGGVVDMNPACMELFGIRREELGDPESGGLERLNVARSFVEPEEYRRFTMELEARGFVDQMELDLKRADGEVVHCLVSSTVRDPPGSGEKHYVNFILDITERKEFERQLQHRALHDPLTELPNRALLSDRLDQAVLRARREGTRLAVFFLDLDRFKAINDSYGHLAGDRVLIGLARHLGSVLRSRDTVARIGGDEFVFLLEGVGGPDEVEAGVERLLTSLGAFSGFDSPPYHLTASVGVVVYDGKDDPPRGEELLRRADIAMYRAKQHRGTTWHLFDPEKDGADLGRHQRERELRRALEAEEFVPVYQPIIELATGRLWGMELLARWEHPEAGRLGAGEFIPLAEETGLIMVLGRQLLTRGLRDLASWAGSGGGAASGGAASSGPASSGGGPGGGGPGGGGPGAVRAAPPRRGAWRTPGGGPRLLFNLSAAQFEDPDLPALTGRELVRSGLAPGSLVLEVTETELMRSIDRVAAFRELGFGLLVDDFGTGYSSLSYLRVLDIDGLKIDMSFVQGAAEHEQDRAIVETILTLGRRLDLQVIAEGIETDEQRAMLQGMGCDYGQGYLFCHPVEPAEAAALVKAGGVAPFANGDGG